MFAIIQRYLSRFRKAEVACIDYETEEDKEAYEPTINRSVSFTLAPVILWKPIVKELMYLDPISIDQLNAIAKDYMARPIDGNFIYDPPRGTILPAGVHDLKVTFIPSNYHKYRSIEAITEIWITQRKPLVYWEYDESNSIITYNTPLNKRHFEKVSCELKEGNFYFSHDVGMVLDIGVHTIRVEYSPSDSERISYSNGYQTRKITVVGVGVDLVWDSLPIKEIVYPICLPVTICTARTMKPDIDGTYTYTPEIGTLLPVGTHVLTCVFEPHNKIRYVGKTTITNTITVIKGTTILQWMPTMKIIDGEVLDHRILNCSNSIDLEGIYHYTPDFGTYLPEGTHNLSVTFIPKDQQNWHIRTAKNIVKVTPKRTPFLYWGEVKPIAYPTPLTKVQLNAIVSGLALKGSMKYEPDFDEILPTGINKLTVTFHPDNPTYTTATATNSIEVYRGKAKLIWKEPDSILQGEGIYDNILTCICTNVKFGKFEYTPKRGTVLKAGSHKLFVKFFPDDFINYEETEASVTLIVRERPKLRSNLVWKHDIKELIYPQRLTIDILNVRCTNITNGTYIYDPPLDTILKTGSHILKCHFIPYNLENCLEAKIESSIIIRQGTPELNWFLNEKFIIYGTPLNNSHHLNAKCTNFVDGEFEYNPPLDTILSPGDYILNCQFVPYDQINYKLMSISVNLFVKYLVPIIEWEPPSTNLIYPFTLTYENHLNPIIKSPHIDVICNGKFSFNISNGTILDCGEHIIHCTFDPDDITRFLSSKSCIKINIIKGDPTIIWKPQSSVMYGSPLDSFQYYNAREANGRMGEFVYDPPVGHNPNVSENCVLTCTFIPKDDHNFHSITLTRSIVVEKRLIMIDWKVPNVIKYGVILDHKNYSTAKISRVEKQIVHNALKNSVFEYNPPIGTMLPVNPNYVLKMKFIPSDEHNYKIVTKSLILKVSPAQPIMKWKPPITQLLFGQKLSDSHLNAKINNPQLYKGHIAYTYPFGSILPVGKHKITANFIPLQPENVLPVSEIFVFDVIKGPPKIVTIMDPMTGRMKTVKIDQPVSPSSIVKLINVSNSYDSNDAMNTFNTAVSNINNEKHKNLEKDETVCNEEEINFHNAHSTGIDQKSDDDEDGNRIFTDSLYSPSDADILNDDLQNENGIFERQEYSQICEDMQCVIQIDETAMHRFSIRRDEVGTPPEL
eukprot:gene4336-6138_t